MSDTVRTFSDLKQEVLNWLDEAGATGTTKTNVGNAMNNAHRRRTMAKPYSFMLWDTPETFTLISGEQTYALHPEFHRAYYFFNRTRKVYLREVGSRQVGPSGAKWNTDKDRPQFTLWGRTCVQEQPSAPSALTIVSSSASDTQNAKAITIRGVANGAVTTETLVPSGTSDVTGSTVFSKILGVTKGAAWTGTLTLKAGSQALLTLNPEEYGRSYQQLFLLAAPTSPDEIEYRFYRLPKPLTNDYDITDIPPGHEQILVWDTLLLLAAYDGRLDAARVNEWKEWQAVAAEALDQAFLETQSLEAEAQYVRDVETETGVNEGPVVWIG